jgi:hypothetical protein
MVWEGLKRNDAATAAGLAESSLRFALRKPHVLAYFRAETAALRENLRARNLHRLDGIADDSKNDQARVKAIQVIEQIADVAEQHHRPGETQRTIRSAPTKSGCKHLSSTKSITQFDSTC